MDDPEEHALVLQALRSGLSNCVVWVHDHASRRVRNDRELGGRQPLDLKRLLLEYVREGGEVIQVRERRSEYRDEFEYYYKVIITTDDIPGGIFIEMRLSDADRDCPIVHLVNAHRQRR